MDDEHVLRLLTEIIRSGKAVDYQLAMVREVIRAYEISKLGAVPNTPPCGPLVRYASLRRSGRLDGWRTQPREAEPIVYTNDPIVRTVKFVEES